MLKAKIKRYDRCAATDTSGAKACSRWTLDKTGPHHCDRPNHHTGDHSCSCAYRWPQC